MLWNVGNEQHPAVPHAARRATIHTHLRVQLGPALHLKHTVVCAGSQAKALSKPPTSITRDVDWDHQVVVLGKCDLGQRWLSA